MLSSSSIKRILIALLLFLFYGHSTFSQHIDYGTVRDIDGNQYRTVMIGKYELMAENLKVTKYNDGTEIPNITNESKWIELNKGAYCWYNNDEKNSKTYGALYNWYAVNSGKLCPRGWHVPTDEEWNYLEKYIDSLSVKKEYEINRSVAGNYLKAEFGWHLNGNGENIVGFSALPGGERPDKIMGFRLIEKNGFWWSSTEAGISDAWFRCIIYSLDDISRSTHNKKFGFSVRCIRRK